MGGYTPYSQLFSPTAILTKLIHLICQRNTNTRTLNLYSELHIIFETHTNRYRIKTQSRELNHKGFAQTQFIFFLVLCGGEGLKRVETET